MRVLFAEKARKCAEAFELGFGLQLDQPPMPSAGERRIQWQVAEKIARRELGRNDQRRRVDVAQNPFVDERVDVQTTDRTDAHTPTAQYQRLASRLEDRQQSGEHRPEAGRVAYGHLAVIGPAGGVVETSRFAHANHDAFD